MHRTSRILEWEISWCWFMTRRVNFINHNGATIWLPLSLNWRRKAGITQLQTAVCCQTKESMAYPHWKTNPGMLHRRSVVHVSWNVTTWDLSIKLSARTRKWRPLTSPRSSWICSKMRVGGRRRMNRSGGYEGGFLLHSSDLLVMLKMSLSKFGQ